MRNSSSFEDLQAITLDDFQVTLAKIVLNLCGLKKHVSQELHTITILSSIIVLALVLTMSARCLIISFTPQSSH